MIKSKENVKNHGEVFTPEYIIKEMCDLIPENVWADPSYVFLEPTCGNGNFLVEIAERRLKYLTQEQVDSTLYGWDISQDNIDECKTRLGFGTNIKVVTDSLVELKNFKTERLVIIGNPPYQRDCTGTRGEQQMSATAIWHLFVDACRNLKPDYFTFITPSRWFSGGRGLTNWRKTWVTDRHISYLKHFPGISEVFPQVVIQSGVSYFLWQKDYNGKCRYVFGKDEVDIYLDERIVVIVNPNDIPLYDKLIKFPTIQTCLKQKPYGIRSNYQAKETGVKCYFAYRKVGYVNPADIKIRKEDMDALGYKYLVPHVQRGTWSCVAPKETLGGGYQTAVVKAIPFWICEPGAIVSESYVVVKTFKELDKAANFVNYMNSRLFRFMLIHNISGTSINNDSYKRVPECGDYSKPMTEDQIFDYFSLTAEEREYLRKRVSTGHKGLFTNLVEAKVITQTEADNYLIEY